MPIYEYKCENGHVFDALQKMVDDALTECEECGAPVERVLHPVAVHFKGSGFYTTDYANKKSSSPAPGDSSSDSGGSSDSKSSDSSSSDSKGSDSSSSSSSSGDKAKSSSSSSSSD